MRYGTKMIRVLFPSIVCETNSASVHLTFDDGPHHEATPRVLEILRKYDVKATFFVVGDNVLKFPDIVREAHKMGHMIANHSLTHQNLFLRGRPFVLSGIRRCNEIVSQTVGVIPSNFRPPRGLFDSTTLRAASDLGTTFTLWSVDSRDFETYNSRRNAEFVINKTHPGSIVLLHDNEATSPGVRDFLPRVLEGLLARNFSFEPLPR
ncbi:MAG TPA: polysaccharide deacetylase family protein [Bacteroidota bacterium]|nr:polysaccharide deacetylase family protein [Bacteroidota bacterium]